MKILEVKINYNPIHGNILRIVVLADFTSVGKKYSDVRAISGDTQVRWGYQDIAKTDQLTQKLVERIAGHGTAVDADKEFPGWKKRYR